MATFRTARHPQLTVLLAGQKLTFQDGVLEVADDETAEAVRMYAQRRPQMGVTEEAAAADEDAPDGDQPSRAELQAALKELGEPATVSNAELAERLAAAQAAAADADNADADNTDADADADAADADADADADEANADAVDADAAADEYDGQEAV